MNEKKEEVKKDIVSNGDTEKEKINAEKTTTNSGQDRNSIIKTIFVWVILIGVVVGGFASGCVRCTNCGANDTRFFIYASGTSIDGVDYKSCVGPAGCLGIGLNSKGWPTECTSIKETTSSGTNLSGCVTYYNEMGCIANSEVKSVGKYSEEATCLGIGCVGTEYVEKVAETTQAKEQITCMGVGCGSSNSVGTKDYNSKMPRQFIKGCWGNN